MIYRDPELARQVGEDPQNAAIPELHKAAFRFAEDFVQRSANAADADIDRLRALGLDDRDIVDWALIATLQTWWVMSADGGGIPLEGNAVTGPVLKHDREYYESFDEGLTAQTRRVARATDNGIAWVDTDLDDPGYLDIAAWCEERYGFVPNIIRASSLVPDIYPRQQLALALLEAPQSAHLSARLHTLVRALVSQVSGASYWQPTHDARLATVGVDPASARSAESLSAVAADDAERAVLALAAKFARNAYKVTAADSESIRDAGLDDEAYVDVLNTTSIQSSLDRLANTLGVAPDGDPIMLRD